jgi:hypothetical protein
MEKVIKQQYFQLYSLEAAVILGGLTWVKAILNKVKAQLNSRKIFLASS